MNRRLAHELVGIAFDDPWLYFERALLTAAIGVYFRQKFGLEVSSTADYELEFITDELNVSKKVVSREYQIEYLNSQGAFRLDDPERVHYTVWIDTEDLTKKQSKWLWGRLAKLGLVPEDGLWFDTLDAAVKFNNLIVETQICVPLSSDISL